MSKPERRTPRDDQELLFDKFRTMGAARLSELFDLRARAIFDTYSKEFLKWCVENPGSDPDSFTYHSSIKLSMSPCHGDLELRMHHDMTTRERFVVKPLLVSAQPELPIQQ